MPARIGNIHVRNRSHFAEQNLERGRTCTTLSLFNQIQQFPNLWECKCSSYIMLFKFSNVGSLVIFVVRSVILIEQV